MPMPVMTSGPMIQKYFYMSYFIRFRVIFTDILSYHVIHRGVWEGGSGRFTGPPISGTLYGVGLLTSKKRKRKRGEKKGKEAKERVGKGKSG